MTTTNKTTAKPRRISIRQRQAVCAHPQTIGLTDCKVCISCEAVIR